MTIALKSGDRWSVAVLTLVAMLAFSAGARADELIPAGAVWRYDDTGTDLGTDWREPLYDDGGWASGPAQLGYGDNDEATKISDGGDGTNRQPCYYFRHSFEVEDPSAYGLLLIRYVVDDGCVIYLNGAEVKRKNLPNGEKILYTTHADTTVGGSDEDFWHTAPANAALLVAGTNVVAVETHQVSATSSDISFDLSMRTIEGLATTVYVDDDAPGDPAPGDTGESDPLEDGSPEHPFDAIQEAIDIAALNATVIVLDGTYTGTGNHDITFAGREITVESQNGPEACIIDCERDGRAFLFDANEGPLAVIDGFTITGGHTGTNDDGAAIGCFGASPTIINNIITGNATDDDGAAIGCNDGAAPNITGNIISENIADDKAGAIYIKDSSPTISRNMILFNSADISGAIHVTGDCSPLIVNNIIAGNSCVTNGGGISSLSNSYPLIFHCTVVDNTGEAGIDGGGGDPIIINCIVWGNGVDLLDCSAAWSCVGVGDLGPGSVSDDPLLDTTYRPGPGSPCIDGGRDIGVYSDFNGDPRPFDWPRINNNGSQPEFDMGAFEGVAEIVDIELTPTSSSLTVGAEDVLTVKVSKLAPPGGYVVVLSVNDEMISLDVNPVVFAEGVDEMRVPIIAASAGEATVSASIFGYVAGQTVYTIAVPIQNGADINRDGCVNVADLLQVRNSIGQTGSEIFPPEADVSPDGAPDGVVNVADLLYVRNRMGEGHACP